MESSLDEISSGNLEWLPYLETFYKGKNGLEVKVQKTEGDIDGKAYRLSLIHISEPTRP